MSGSSPSTIHSMKMEPAISPKLHWLSLGNVHCTRFRNIPERIDAILRRVHTEVHYADSGCGVESGIERNHTPRRRDSLAFTVIPKLPLRSSTTNPTLYQCYHPRVSTTFSAVSANHFSFLTGWLWFHLTSLSMPLHLRSHDLVTTYRLSKASVECK